MPAETLKNYLEANQVPYNIIEHRPAFTAQEIAASAHISGKKVAKNVIVKIDGKLAMVVMPADRLIDLEELKQELGTEDLALAHESDFAGAFPDCETGFEPPFGNLYGLPVYVSRSLRRSGDIVFNAGTRNELIDLQYQDFESLVKPTLI